MQPAGFDPDVDVAIVGTGFSGLGMAIALEKERRRSYVLFEKAGGVGGTWRDNHYPGCVCDIPSNLYSYSFEPNPRWSRAFAPQPEILAYLEHCAAKYDVLSHVRFHTEVKTARFDEHAGLWHLTTGDGGATTARHLVLGLGGLRVPAYPDLPGLDRFAGRRFHSAEWDDGHDLTGERVAVIGTGASAIQIVPQIAPRVRTLHVFQRTAPWLLPKRDRSVTALEQRLFAALPWVQRLRRWSTYVRLEAQGVGFTARPGVMKAAALLGRRHIRRQVRDPALRAAVTPDYVPGCKRILLANDYYPALERPNVELITAPIARVTERSVVTADGVERPVDTLVFGTGFRVGDYLSPMCITGRGGRDLAEAWKSRAEAYLGTMVAGFPNLYTLTGPNTGLGHNSMVFMIEAQIAYVMRLLGVLDRRGARVADVRPAAQSAYNAGLAPRLSGAVWASGCRSWYLDEHGNNAVLWPGLTLEFWLRTRRVRARDYVFDPLPRDRDRARWAQVPTPIPGA